jgi:hypothetical protein
VTARFRWRYQDDSLGETWSDWHVDGPDCPACCHCGPREGAHQQGAAFYDEDEALDWSAHTTCDPRVDDDYDIEWS